VKFKSNPCLLRCLNLEFGFALTGLEKLEVVVGLPDFSGPFSDEDYISNQESHFQEHFASQIVLRRLLIEFHSVLNHGTTPFLVLMLLEVVGSQFLIPHPLHRCCNTTVSANAAAVCSILNSWYGNQPPDDAPTCLAA
jgi:hypothetical protein